MTVFICFSSSKLLVKLLVKHPSRVGTMIKQSYKRVAIVNVDDAMQVYLAVRLLIFNQLHLRKP